MKILVVSDTHGHAAELKNIVAEQSPAQIIFLGDGLSEMRAFKRVCRVPITMVRGNCDRAQEVPLDALLFIEGQLLYMCHGHTFDTKQNVDGIAEAAKLRGADIALFGHTHKPFYTQIDGLHLFNPGTLSQPRGGGRSYGIITIENGSAPRFEHRFL